MSKGNGFLTGADRDFLNGEKEYTGKHAKQNRYKRREGIAKRTRAAFADFALLYDQLDESERNRIFGVDQPDNMGVPIPTRGLYGDIINTVAFLYLALEGEQDSSTTADRWFSVPFERVLKQGVKSGERRRYGRHVLVEVGDLEVDVRTNLDPGTVEAAIDKLARQEYDSLTESEMFTVLFRFGEIHGDESYARLADRVDERRAELEVDVADPMDIEAMFSGDQ